MGALVAVVVLTLCACGRHGFAPRDDGGSSDGAEDALTSGDAPTDAAPNVSWAVRFGGLAEDVGGEVAIAPNGDIIVAGNFSGTMNLLGASHISAGSSDVILAAITPSGLVRWSKAIGSASADSASGVTVTTLGVACVSGRFSGTLIVESVPLSSAGSDDIFIACYDSTGGFENAWRIGGSSVDHAFDLASSGPILAVGGYVEGNVDFGGGVTAGAAENAFVAAYSVTGTFQWATRFSVGQSHVHAIAPVSDGTFAITGDFPNTATIGTSTLTSAGSWDPFVTVIGATGASGMAWRYGGPGDEEPRAGAADTAGNIYIGGYYRSSLTFGSTMPAVGGDDLFVAQVTAARTPGPAFTAGSATNDIISDIAAGPRVLAAGTRGPDAIVYEFAGSVPILERMWTATAASANSVAFSGSDVIVVGSFSGTIVLEGASLTSAGMSDGFIVRYTR